MSRRMNFKSAVVLVGAVLALSSAAQSTIRWTRNAVVVDGNTAQNALTEPDIAGCRVG